MFKEYLDYDCTIHHHEHEEMKLRLEYSSSHEDVLINIEVPDGGGHSGNASRIYITASELREITFITNRYIDARQTMEMEGDINGTA